MYEGIKKKNLTNFGPEKNIFSSINWNTTINRAQADIKDFTEKEFSDIRDNFVSDGVIVLCFGDEQKNKRGKPNPPYLSLILYYMIGYSASEHTGCGTAHAKKLTFIFYNIIYFYFLHIITLSKLEKIS